MNKSDIIREISFPDDSPITDSSQDLFGRDKFANNIANLISNWHGNEGVVIGLYGEWGAGKTSVKNLIKNHIKLGESDTDIVEFNPWMWNDEETVIFQFFNELKIAFSNSENISKETSEKIVNGITAIFSSLFSVSSSFIEVVGTIEGVNNPLVIPGSKLASKSLKFISKKLKSPKNKMQQTKRNKKSIREIYDEIDETLKNNKSKLLVIIDDIDRLNSNEILLVFQLLKVNFNLPNIIYMVLCDREVVENAFEVVSKNNGKKYLDKIIQFGIDLPLLNEGSITEYFEKYVEKYLCFSEQIEKSTSRQRDNYYSIIKSFFSTPRELKRFLSSFIFILKMFERDGFLEVNIFDLFCLEVLRIFNPSIYHALPNFRSIICPDYSLNELSSLPEDERKEAEKEKTKNLLELSNPNYKRRTEQLLQILFPKFETITNTFYTHDFDKYDELQRKKEKRISDLNYFGNYFIYSINENIPSHSLIMRTFENIENHSKLNQIFLTVLDKGFENEFINQIELNMKNINRNHNLEIFLNWLLWLGDNAENSLSIFNIIRVVNRCLEVQISEEEAGEIIRKCIVKSKGIIVPMEFIYFNSLEDVEYSNVSKDSLLVIKNEVEKKITKISRLNRISDEVPEYRLPDFLDLWERLFDNECIEIKKFVIRYIKSDHNAKNFIKRLISDTIYDKADPLDKLKYYISIKDLKELYKRMEFSYYQKYSEDKELKNKLINLHQRIELFDNNN